MNIEKLREEIEYDEEMSNPLFGSSSFTYFNIGILLENQTQNTDGKSEHLLVTIDALSPNEDVKTVVSDCTSYTQTLMICQGSKE